MFIFVCKIPLLARALGQARARDDRVSCIQCSSNQIHFAYTRNRRNDGARAQNRALVRAMIYAFKHILIILHLFITFNIMKVVGVYVYIYNFDFESF